jgi:hypothetical protein
MNDMHELPDGSGLNLDFNGWGMESGMTKEKATSDPFPNLPRRSLYVGLDVRADPDVPLREVQLRDSENKILAKIVNIAAPGDAGALTADEQGAMESALRRTAAVVAKGKRGRPSLGKPWEAEGISRSAYFERKAKLKGREK